MATRKQTTTTAPAIDLSAILALLQAAGLTPEAIAAGRIITVNENEIEPAMPTRKPAPKQAPKGTGRESTFSASVCDRLSIPRKQGGTFTYSAKRGVSTWKVAHVLDSGGVVAVKQG